LAWSSGSAAAAAEIERRFTLLGRFDEEVSNSQTKGVEMAVPELATGRWRTRDISVKIDIRKT
jgi:hypothetical protein